MNRVATFLRTIGVEPDSDLARDLRDEGLEELAGELLRSAESKVVWLNRPAREDATGMRAAARTGEAERRPAPSPRVDLKWNGDGRSFALREMEETLLLSCSIDASDPTPAGPLFTSLHWFDRRFSLKRCVESVAEWEVILPPKHAHLLIARMASEVDELGEGAVLPWVS